jgi:hypothetical protein
MLLDTQYFPLFHLFLIRFQFYFLINAKIIIKRIVPIVNSICQNMNFLVNNKTKPKFTLKSIENSNLFRRRASNSNCLIDDYEISKNSLLSLQSNYDKSYEQIITHTNITPIPMTPQNADNTEILSARILSFSEVEMEQAKSAKFEVNRGSV